MLSWRRSVRVAAAVVLALVTIAADQLSTQGRNVGRSLRTAIVDGREAVEGEVLVRYRARAGALERRRAEFAVESAQVEAIGRRGAHRMRSRRLSTRAMLLALRNNPDVEYAEPNFIIRLMAVPNDPLFGNLWGLFNSGQSAFGTPAVAGADIHVVNAWDATTGSRANVVGVIDSGIDYNHVDLAANIWTAPREFSVTIDGLTITCAAGTHGFNAITNSCDPMDDLAHGTHVAGTIGAVGNNGIGVTGVNWVASMMGLKFLDVTGSGLTSDAVKAIEFALQAKAALGADANVRILSASWGSYGESAALASQIQAAGNADVLVVAAAGNDGSNNDALPFYPSSYPYANIISVASTTNGDARSAFSNYGATSVHVGAPGSVIFSTVLNNDYAFRNGTSMATPHVAGAAALVLAGCPATTATLRAALLGTVDPVPGLSGTTITGGRVNVEAAMQRCIDGVPSLTASLDGTTITAVVTNSNGNARNWLGLFCPASNNDGTYLSWKYLNGTQTPPAVGSTAATVTFAAPAQGGVSCNVRLFSPTWARLAVSDTLTVPTRTPTVTATASTVLVGGAINVVVAEGPGGATDWLALADSSAPDSNYRDWKYLNGLRTPPASGLSGAAVQFAAPSTPGIYTVRLFANNTYNRIATSGLINVVAPSTLTINDVSVVEGHSGTTAAVFTITLSPPHASQTVTVAYATADGTATVAGDDYLAASGTLTFAPGTATQTISMSVNGDTVIEPDETFFVNLSGAANAVIGDAHGIGTIVSDDVAPGPTVSVSTPSVRPGGTIAFSVTGGPANPTDWVALVDTAAPDSAYVRWSYMNGSQVAPASGLANAALQFIAPSAQGTYDVRVFANNRLTRIGRSDPIAVSLQPMLTIGDVTIAEGHSGTSLATFTVTLSPVNASQTVTVAYATEDGTAMVAGNDYAAAAGTLTFAPTTATQSISVTVNGDLTPEADETFVVRLSGATNAVIGDAQAIGTITNDDLPDGPTLSVATPRVGPGDTISFSVLNGPANPTDWVTLVERTAADNAYLQWQYLNGSTSPPATGRANATLQFTAPAASGVYELRLFANNRLTRIARSGDITVATEPTLTIGDVAVTEGHSGTTAATFTVRLSPLNPAQTVTVNYATADLTATLADNDYVAAAGTLTFPPSTATQTITVMVNGDTVVEPSESFVVNLSDAVNAVIADAQAVGTIVNDDGQTVGPAVAVASTTVQPGGFIEFVVSGGPANPLDWVTLGPAAAPDDAYGDWNYLNGTKIATTVGQNGASLRFIAPSTPGTYNIRFFADNRLANKLATSATITVAP